VCFCGCVGVEGCVRGFGHVGEWEGG